MQWWGLGRTGGGGRGSPGKNILFLQNLDFRRKKPNHRDDLEEGGDEEEVGEEEGEHQGGDTPTLLPLAEGDLRYKV